ncbi:uncharacterized protein METZ01_LOCUS407376, partial [marine metagenome]
AQGNAITNVGNPTQDNDAVNLSTVRDMSGMKPERIYSYNTSGVESWSLNVPSDKIWQVFYVATDSYSTVKINGQTTYIHWGEDSQIWLQPNSQLENYANGSYFFFSIFEYPISSSGTDQGMDYIEP